jgi:hypothetical protein
MWGVASFFFIDNFYFVKHKEFFSFGTIPSFRHGQRRKVRSGDRLGKRQRRRQRPDSVQDASSGHGWDAYFQHGSVPLAGLAPVHLVVLVRAVDLVVLARAAGNVHGQVEAPDARAAA